MIMPDYFRSIGISLKAGRTLKESDTATAEKAVVVNEAFVKDYLADVANPLGQRVYIGKMFGFEQPWRIVGVVSDARQFNLRSAPPATRMLRPKYPASEYALASFVGVILA